VQGIAAGSKERMSVNSVSTRLPPSYNLLSGNKSPTARSAAAANERTEKAFGKASASQFTGAPVRGAKQDASVTSGDSTDDHLQSTLEQALHEGAATAGKPGDGTSESPASPSSSGIALYQRVSQYGNSEPRTSALLESWNSIMQGGPDADSAAAAFAKALSQHQIPGSESGVLDLTA
jgi:hypothetical protein